MEQLQQHIESIEIEWSPETGFFGKLREGIYEARDVVRVRQKLKAITVDDDTVIPRRLISLLWYIPVFMEWQSDRIAESGADIKSYSAAVAELGGEIERILGVP